MSKKNQLLEKELPSETSENKEFIENEKNLTTENTLQNSERKNTTDGFKLRRQDNIYGRHHKKGALGQRRDRPLGQAWASDHSETHDNLRQRACGGAACGLEYELHRTDYINYERMDFHENL